MIKKEKITKNLTLTNNNKGITLIALVITIIVLLILAGVTINLTLGENGIFKTAERAREEQADSTVVEAISLAWLEYQIAINEPTGAVIESETKIASTTQVRIQEENTMSFLTFLKDEKKYINENGVINVEALTGGRLSRGNGTDGLTDVYKIELDDTTNSYTLKYYEEENKSEILWQVGASSNSTTGEIDWDKIFAEAKPAEGQSESNTAIGIGANGDPVNMDYWLSRKNDEGNAYILVGEPYGSSSQYSSAYTQVIDESGEIKGVIPQYIKKDGDETFLEVTSLYYTFNGCTNLTTAPAIPPSVTDMSYTFYECTSLTTAPEIPSSVISMSGTFSGCTNLTTAPEIPSSVTDMSYTFSGCTNLATAPAIPPSVTDMWDTFSGCTSLTTAPEIPSSVTDMSYTFSGCTNLATAPEIPSSVTDMGSTFSRCTNLITAPEIPSSVTEMGGTFSECTSLTTAPEIPSGVTSLYGTFSRCTSLTTAPEIPSGVTSLHSTFVNCTSLTTAPEIPSSVTDMTQTFYGCRNLKGEIKINARPESYSSCFSVAATSGEILTLVGSDEEVLTNLQGTKSTGSNIKIRVEAEPEV